MNTQDNSLCFGKLIQVVLTYRDDKKEEFLCIDFPQISDWVTLYLADGKFGRKIFPRECLADIYYCVK